MHPPTADDGDSPGPLDDVATVELNHRLGQMMVRSLAIATDMADVEKTIRFHTAQNSKADDPTAVLAKRPHVAAALAKALDPFATRLEEDVNEYRALSEGVDAFVRAHLKSDQSEAGEVDNSLILLARSIIAMGEFNQWIQQIGSSSRALRQPANRIRRAVQRMRDTEPTLVSWVADCR